jgi:FkbM family methyltransferase
MTTRVRNNIFFVVLGLAFVYLIAAFFYYPLRSRIPFYGRAEPYIRLVRYAPFSDGVCPFWRRIQGMERSIAIDRRAEEIAGHSTLLRTDAGGLEFWRTPKGDIWLPQTGDLTAVATVLAEQEANLYGPPGGLGVHAGDTVLDGGAHVGLFTRTALASGAKLVVAIEPTPESVECIRRNEAEGIRSGRVIVVSEGVSDKPGMVTFQRVATCSVCNREVDANHARAGSFDAKLTTIDELVTRLKLERVDFIKLDIENAELKAIQGGRHTIAAYRPRLAVATENALDRSAYATQIISEIQGLKHDYRYLCGTCSVVFGNVISVKTLNFF